jgi:hypothetical protein
VSSQKRTKIMLVCASLIVVLGVSFLAAQLFLQQTPTQASVASIPYIGIAFAGNTTDQAIAQIDRAKNYTNLFILDTGRNPLSRNQTAVYEVADYAVANGLSIILNLGISDPHENDSSTWFWEQNMANGKVNFTERWGDKFLGIYDNDEPGGIQLDGDWKTWYAEYGEYLDKMNHSAMDDLYKIYQKMLAAHGGILPQNYDLEAEFFINEVLLKGDLGLAALNEADITTFTSDYGLYWFDYLGGYDVMFAELGWNASVAQQIGLVKGAARLMDKEWGAMITWKYMGHPFLDTPENIYNQMLAAYQAGAKYITIFDFSRAGNSTSYAMTDKYYTMLEIFWNDIHNQTHEDLSGAEAALVLPANYGWGMRNPDDTIWGFWGADDKTQQIATVMYNLLEDYSVKLDIVYEDPAYPVTRGGYKQIFYWNSTDV